MIILPRIHGFICTTAHPQGCAKMVEEQIQYIKGQQQFSGPKNVLIIGASTGYGLASRIVSTFGAGAKTIGVFFEKPATETRTASSGWYNSAAFEEYAFKEHHYAKSINADAFSHEAKVQTAELIRRDLKSVDLVIYSLASPRRKHPDTDEIFSTALKPINKQFVEKTVDVFRGEIKEVTIEPATDAEVESTEVVMGGEDWELWIHYLKEQNVLSPNCITVAYSYIGPELTHDIYKNGTIGKAKEHLQHTANKLDQLLKSELNGKALVSINKAVVTQASAAIPVLPLYLSLLIKTMTENGTEEGCIEQIYRLFHDIIYAQGAIPTCVYVDEHELAQEVQEKIKLLWPQITSDNLYQLTDILMYRKKFKQLFGFDVEGIDYEEDVNPEVKIRSINEKE